MENPTDKITASFNMDALRANLPHKRSLGLSRYYSGKSRSFACMEDVQCLEDLKKHEGPETKRRKKHCTDRKDSHLSSPHALRSTSTAASLN